MTGAQLAEGRKRKGWNQQRAASRLCVSQGYLSLLERGDRPVTAPLARRAARVYGLSPATLPLESTQSTLEAANEEGLALDLAALGYPGFAHLKRAGQPRLKRKRNPAEVLASALKASNLDSRVVEALPWLISSFPELDWPWLLDTARLNDLQNRLGFITSVARQVAERRGETDKAALLARNGALLEQSRLAREDTLCHASMTQAERNWLQGHRPNEAKHWGLLTDLALEHLGYVD
jgi:transcriptional regulator with XRE-family HTH domain